MHPWLLIHYVWNLPQSSWWEIFHNDQQSHSNYTSSWNPFVSQRHLSLQYRFCSSTLDIFLFQVYRDPTSSVQVEETWDFVHKWQPGVHHRPSWFAELGGVGYLGSTEQQHQPSAARTGQLHFHQVSGLNDFVIFFCPSKHVAFVLALPSWTLLGVIWYMPLCVFMCVCVCLRSVVIWVMVFDSAAANAKHKVSLCAWQKFNNVIMVVMKH